MSEVDTTPPTAVADNADKGLRLRREHGRGGTRVGVARARDLKNRRNLSAATIRRMVSYFARHEVDKQADGFGNDDAPSAGYIAWLLWGGDEGRDWARNVRRRLGG
ncbi:MAG: hypothetical protein R3E87_20925 [Burkholderiaceae bacterium]